MRPDICPATVHHREPRPVRRGTAPLSGRGRLDAGGVYKRIVLPRRGVRGSFAPRRDLLLSIVTKVGKSTGRNLRFPHLRARYTRLNFDIMFRTFTRSFLFRFVKRIASASAPLPLMPMTNNASASTVDTVSGSGARRKSIRHTKRNQLCSVNAWYKAAN